MCVGCGGVVWVVLWKFCVLLARVWDGGVVFCLCELLRLLLIVQKSSTNTRQANDAFLLKLPPISRNCSDTFLIVPSLMEPHMNGTSLMNVSDGCPTLTCSSLKLRRCYFYVISTVNMLLVIQIKSSNQKLFIHTYKQVHSVYKNKVFKNIYIYTNTTIVDIMHSIYI